MRHVEYPARTERTEGLQHTNYPRCPGDRQGQSHCFPGTVLWCWQMPSLCSTSLLKPIRNFFGSGFALAGKISLLTRQQRAFCDGSPGLSLLSPQEQSWQPRSPPGTKESKPHSFTLPGCLPPPPRHGWGHSSFPFGCPGTQTPCPLSFCQRDGGGELGTSEGHSKRGELPSAGTAAAPHGQAPAGGWCVAKSLAEPPSAPPLTKQAYL